MVDPDPSHVVSEPAVPRHKFHDGELHDGNFHDLDSGSAKIDNFSCNMCGDP